MIIVFCLFRILHNLDILGEKLKVENSTKSTSQKVVTDFIALEVWNLKPGDAQVIGLKVRSLD